MRLRKSGRTNIRGILRYEGSASLILRPVQLIELNGFVRAVVLN